MNIAQQESTVSTFTSSLSAHAKRMKSGYNTLQDKYLVLQQDHQSSSSPPVVLQSRPLSLKLQFLV